MVYKFTLSAWLTFHERFPSQECRRALALGSLDTLHGQQQLGIFLLAPHKGGIKQGQRCNHVTGCMVKLLDHFPVSWSNRTASTIVPGALRSAVKFVKPWMSSHFSEWRDPSYVGSAMWPGKIGETSPADYIQGKAAQRSTKDQVAW